MLACAAAGDGLGARRGTRRARGCFGARGERFASAAERRALARVVERARPAQGSVREARPVRRDPLRRAARRGHLRARGAARPRAAAAVRADPRRGGERARNPARARVRRIRPTAARRRVDRAGAPRAPAGWRAGGGEGAVSVARGVARGGSADRALAARLGQRAPRQRRRRRAVPRVRQRAARRARLRARGARRRGDRRESRRRSVGARARGDRERTRRAACSRCATTPRSGSTTARASRGSASSRARCSRSSRAPTAPRCSPTACSTPIPTREICSSWTSPARRQHPRLLFVDFGLSRRLDPALRRELRKGMLALLSARSAGVPRRHGAARRDRAGRIATTSRAPWPRCSSASAVRAGSPRAARRCSRSRTRPWRCCGETPGLRLPVDLLLYAKTLSYVFSLGAELDREVDMMKLCLPSLLRFLAEKD